MKPRIFRSLRARLVVGAAIWTAISVAAAGFFIYGLFYNYTYELVDDELNEHLNELVSLLEIMPDGTPKLSRPISDPRFNDAKSGFSWQISRNGQVLLKSASIAKEAIPVPNDALNGGEIRKLTLSGPRGPLIAFEQSLLPTPLRLQIQTEAAVVDRLLPRFRTPLTFSMLLLSLASIAAAVLQVAFGLRPLRRLKHALKAVESGKAEKLPEGFPVEIQPLVDDLNNLLSVNAEMILRARTQAGNLAHALKTPLAVMTNEGYRLESLGESKSASLILQQSRRMQQQIDYQIARARAAASHQVPGVIAPVAPALDRIISAMNRLYCEKNLVIDVSVGEGCVTACDHVDLNEMLANLIDNACKWATAGVRIRATADAKKVIIRIEDDGPGVPPESMETVFRIGERLDDSVPGSGLGLPIVRDLAQLYGGEIQLTRSEIGGLAAVLVLPKARSAAIESETSPLI